MAPLSPLTPPRTALVDGVPLVAVGRQEGADALHEDRGAVTAVGRLLLGLSGAEVDTHAAVGPRRDGHVADRLGVLERRPHPARPVLRHRDTGHPGPSWRPRLAGVDEVLGTFDPGQLVLASRGPPPPRLAVLDDVVDHPKPVLAQPETTSSHRTIPLADFLLEALADHLRRFPTPREELVLQTPTGLPVDADRFGHQWRRACRAADVPGLKYHALRHTFASTLLSRGVSR